MRSDRLTEIIVNVIGWIIIIGIMVWFFFARGKN